jgi:DNA-directed RNA polymerase I, II, and III subunit RPABC2
MPPKIKNNIKENELKINKSKNKKKLDDSDIEDENLEEDDENEEIDEDDENEEVDEDDDINDDNNDNDSFNQNINEESENESESESDNDSSKDKEGDNNDDDNEDNYIDNEETMSKKCYKKYVSMEDDINLEEIFGDEENIIKEDRLTKPILTKYERVRILSTRIKQLAQGAKPMLKNYAGLSSKEMALEELKHKIIPIIIERPVPNVGIEKWKLSELDITL